MIVPGNYFGWIVGGLGWVRLGWVSYALAGLEVLYGLLCGVASMI